MLLACVRGELPARYRRAVSKDASESDGALLLARQHEAHKESSSLLLRIVLKLRRVRIRVRALRGLSETWRFDVGCLANSAGTREPRLDVFSERN